MNLTYHDRYIADITGHRARDRTIREGTPFPYNSRAISNSTSYFAEPRGIL